MSARLHHILLPPTLLLSGCGDTNDSNPPKPQTDRITRRHGEYLFIPPPPTKVAPLPYPWEEGIVTHLPKITKEFFRCKGSCLNPERIVEKQGKTTRIADCGGTEKHSLPLKDQQEFIYPILINLMNHIQSKTEKRVVITSGHRCPEHNSYVDPSAYNSYSKHLIGAEVSFYVQGMEYQPQKVVDIILAFFREEPKYQDRPEFQRFQRYEKEDTNVSIQPWYNKEVFIKLFSKDEGRNFDNRH
ncbi:MAG: hypothetical protein ACE5GN_01465, partial [Waddliaceae bacterium]